MVDRLNDPELREAYQALMRDAAPPPHIDAAAWERIATGDIAPERRDAAFDHVVSCERCARIWKGVLALEDGARAEGLLPAARQSGSWLRSPLVQLALAATLIVVIGTVVMRTRPDAPGPASATPPATPAPPRSAFIALPLTKAEIHITAEEALAPRGASAPAIDPPVERLAAALEPYRRDDFGEAANRLGTLLKEFPNAARPALYYGVSLLFVDRNDEALAPLRTAMTSSQAPVAADARWYLAVALTRTGQPAAALAELRGLCAAGGPSAERACTAQRAIEANPR